MKIPLIEIIDQAIFEFTNLNAAELNLDENRYRGNSEIKKARIKLSKKALGISADFNVHFAVDLVCARCLSSFRREFEETLHLDYIAGKDPLLSLEKVELKAGDIDRVYYSGPYIDIGVGIRESIILNIPPAPLCKKDCQGLCPICGKNLNREKCNCNTQKNGLFNPNLKTKK